MTGALGLLLACLAPAEPAPAAADSAPVLAGDAARVRATGDLVLRYEAVRDAPAPAQQDFGRLRMLLRPGFEWSSSSGQIKAGAGLRASASTDANDDNEIRRDNFVSDEVTGDRIYLGFRAAELPFSATLGIFETPLAGSEVLWDRDIRFHGLAAGIELPGLGPLLSQRLHGAFSLGSQNHEDESRAAALRWEAEATQGLSFGAALWHFGETEALVEAGYARTNRLASDGSDFESDFAIVDLSLGWERFGSKRPLRSRLDLLVNAGADDRRTGFDLRVDWGELQDLGSFRVRLALQRIEQDAALAAFGGDEWWFRTEQRGARLALALGLDRHAFVEVAVLHQRRDRLDEWLERYTLDLVARF